MFSSAKKCTKRFSRPNIIFLNGPVRQHSWLYHYKVRQRTRIALIKRNVCFVPSRLRARLKSMRPELFPILLGAGNQHLNYTLCSSCTIGGTITSQITNRQEALGIFSRTDCVRGCEKMAMSAGDPVAMVTTVSRDVLELVWP